MFGYEFRTTMFARSDAQPNTIIHKRMKYVLATKNAVMFMRERRRQPGVGQVERIERGHHLRGM